MAGYCLYEQTLIDLDTQISYKQNELDRVKAIPENEIVKNTVIQSLNEDLTELRNKRSYYTQFFSNLLMNNCVSCSNGKCWRYY